MLKNVASSTISQTLSKVFTAIIAIFLISALTKYLPPEMYGQYNKIYNYLSIFTSLADLGLYAISIREISKNKNDAFKIIGNVMTLRLILGVIIVFLSLFIALFLPGYNDFFSMISIFIVSLFSVVSLLNSSVLSLMQSFMKIEFSLFATVLGKLANLALVFGVIFIIYPKPFGINLDMAFILIMMSGLVGIIVNFLLNFYYANRIVKIRLLFDKEYIKYLLKTSFSYGIALFLSAVYLKVDVILISLIEPSNVADTSIALYSLPMKIIEVLMMVGGFFLNSILPILTGYFKEMDYKKVAYVAENSFRFLFSLSLVILVLGVLLGKDIILTIATKDYLLGSGTGNYDSYDVLVLALFTLFFSLISSLFNYIFMSSNKEKTLLYINSLVMIFNVIGNILLIPRYSFFGSAIVAFFSQILLAFLGYYYSRKIVRFDYDISYMIKMTIFSALVYLFGDHFISNYSFGNLINIMVYGGIIFTVFSFYTLFLNLYLIKKNRL